MDEEMERLEIVGAIERVKSKPHLILPLQVVEPEKVDGKE